MSTSLQWFTRSDVHWRKECSKMVRKLFYTLIAVLILQPAHAGAQLISIDKDNETIGNILKEVKRQSGYHLFYSNNEVDTEKRISVKLKNASLDLTLRTILGKQFDYKIIDKNIVITPANKLLEEAELTDVFLNIIITGHIINSSGEPLAQASVKIKNTQKGTFANQKGEFSITIDNENTILIFSYTGYQTKEIVVSKQRDIIVRLEEDAKTLNETVVTGYQAFTNRTAPGVISTVKPEDITQKGSFSVDQMLEGKVAGMAVTGNIGNPGAPPKIRIRGTSSITGDQEPIWVIDGVIWEEAIPVRNRDLATVDDVSLLNMIGGSVAGLNPKDIESINVLKDAAATAIYGVRAANGVIVITTKKGKSGETRINYSSDLRVTQKPTYNDFNIMNSAQRVGLSQDIVNQGLSYYIRPNNIGYEGALMNLRNKNITQEEFDQQAKYFASLNTDWFDVLFRNAFSQNHTISVSGGIGKSTFYFSSSIYDEKANAKESSLSRYTASARINTRLRNNLNLDIKVGGNIRENNSYHSSIDPFKYATNTSRAIPVMNTDGSLAYYDRKNSIETNNPGLLSYNILNEIANTGNKSKTREMNAQATIRYNFLKYFQYEGTGFYATSSSDIEEWATERSYHIAYNYRGYNYGALDPSHPNVDLFALIPNGGVLKPYNSNSDNYTLRNAFTFNKDVFKKANLNVMLGTEARSVKQKGLSQILPGYFPERGGLFSVPTTTAYVNGISARNSLIAAPRIINSVSNYFSLYSSAVLNVMDKYILNGNVRYDGSNKFGKNPKYRYLPTFSTAFKWIASEERFLERLVDNKQVDFVALNASFGLQGNIKSNAHPGLVTSVDEVDRYGRTVSSVVSLGNPGLRWEKTYSYNLGLEFGLFNRFNFRADYYYKKGKDLLIEKVVSQVEGRETVLLNAGDMENKGIEFTLSGYPVKLKNFTWRSRLVAANNQNRISKAYVANPSLASKLNGTAVIEGQPLGTLYSYEFAGLDDKGVPLYYINDGNHSKARSMNSFQENLVNSGSVNPKFNGGFDNDFRYKDFTLTVAITYSLGAHSRLPLFYPDGNFTTLPLPEQSFSSEYINRWKQQGDEMHTAIPLLMDRSSGVGYITEVYGLSAVSSIPTLYNNSDLRTAKLSYARLRALNLSYAIPSKFTRKINSSAASIYFSAQNLWYVTTDKDKLNGVDPEIIGAPGYALPLPRIFNAGINISF